MVEKNMTMPGKLLLIYSLAFLLFLSESVIAADTRYEIKFKLQTGSVNKEIILKKLKYTLEPDRTFPSNRRTTTNDHFIYITLTEDQQFARYDLTTIRRLAMAPSRENNFMPAPVHEHNPVVILGALDLNLEPAQQVEDIRVIPFNYDVAEVEGCQLLLENFPAIPFSNGNGFYLPIVSAVTQVTQFTQSTQEHTVSDENQNGERREEKVFHVLFDYSGTGARIEPIAGIIRVNAQTREIISLEITGGRYSRILTPVGFTEESSEEGSSQNAQAYLAENPSGTVEVPIDVPEEGSLLINLRLPHEERSNLSPLFFQPCSFTTQPHRF